MALRTGFDRSSSNYLALWSHPQLQRKEVGSGGSYYTEVMQRPEFSVEVPHDIPPADISDDIAAINPGIIYCSITGFGQTGPRAQEPGYDYLAQGMGGFMSITGVADGEPGAGPQRAGLAVADLTTGMYSVIGILAALRHRDATGRGQRLDMALLDTASAASCALCIGQDRLDSLR